MNEKVDKKIIGIEVDFKISETGNFIAVTKDCLVLVVSVEWLEKWCKENRIDVLNGSKEDATIFVESLLKAVRLQAKSEAKKE